MDLQRLTILLLAAAVAIATVRMLWFAWRRPPLSRPHAWRLALLLVLQAACAVLLYRTLFPPHAEGAVDTLVVATAEAPVSTGDKLAAHERLVALPEAPTLPGAERVPDLGTALRRHPGIAHVHVIGSGLGARDRDALHGVRVSFDPVPLPRGIVELSAPRDVQAGADFIVSGRVHGATGSRIELIDPSGQRVDRATLTGEGRFALTGAARVTGAAEFRLRALAASGAMLDEAIVPLVIAAPRPIRVLVLASGPDAELKYLRRWGIDSGTSLHTQIQLGGGMQVGGAPIAFDAATLKAFDAAVVDERAWDAMGDARRRALAAAVRDGLGLLVRITGPVSPGARRSLAALGLDLISGPPDTFALPQSGSTELLAARLGPGTQDAPTSAGSVTETLPRLARQPLRPVTRDAHAWLRDSEGHALAAWSALGRGRAALWLPADTYQLVLVGRKDLHAALWSEALGVVARPRAPAALAPPMDTREGERVALCGVSDDAVVVAPDGRTTTLMPDPAIAVARCAGFWPRMPGWHTWRDGEDAVAFHVRSRSELPALAARERMAATQLLTLARTDANAAPSSRPRNRWPWFLAWLLASALLWWLERSRFGKRQA